jgi:predicted nucleic acid-binding protein
VPDCLVIGFEQLAKSRDTPDPRDSHVVAVAIKAGAQVVVTYNLKKFPYRKLNIEAQHPMLMSSFKKRKTKLPS